MTDLFLYGTLRWPALLETVLGHDLAPNALVPAVAPDHAVHWAKDEAFPMISAAPGAQAEGVILRNVSDDDLARLDYYEGGFGYDLTPIALMTGDGPATAQVYFPQEGRWTQGALWSLEDWLRDWGQISLSAAQEVMARRGRWSPKAIANVLPFFRARGWARQMGAEGAPQTLRAALPPEDLDLTFHPDSWDGFFQMRSFSLRHRRFDGQWSPPMERECFVAFDAALVLPYDPKTDHVMLIEQLRFGPVMRGDPGARVLEPAAGLIDARESPEQAARREMLEETGQEVGDLIAITKGYASPGYSTEFFHYFIGLCDLPQAGTGHGGLESENEDIRTHILRFDEAMALVDSGEINVTPLIMMLLWLARHRDGLRAAG